MFGDSSTLHVRDTRARFNLGGGVWAGKVIIMASSKRGRKRKREEDPVIASTIASETDEKGTSEADEKFTFFFGAGSPFSQWHYAQFTLDDVEYNCAEQYMMHQKAGK